MDKRALQAFSATAEEYERSRASYPPELIRELLEAAEVPPAPRIVDLAAGTGKLTEVLVPLAGSVVAVEPVKAMLAVLARRLPSATALLGTAEEIPVPDESADVVSVGEAFHWFEAGPALDEIARVLAPGGALVVVFSAPQFDDDEPWPEDLSELLSQAMAWDPKSLAPRPGDPRNWEERLERHPAFGPAMLREQEFVHSLTADGYVDQVLSWSAVAVRPADERAELAVALAEVLARNGIDEMVTRYVCKGRVARRVGTAGGARSSAEPPAARGLPT